MTDFSTRLRQDPTGPDQAREFAFASRADLHFAARQPPLKLNDIAVAGASTRLEQLWRRSESAAKRQPVQSRQGVLKLYSPNYAPSGIA